MSKLGKVIRELVERAKKNAKGMEEREGIHYAYGCHVAGLERILSSLARLADTMEDRQHEALRHGCEACEEIGEDFSACDSWWLDVLDDLSKTRNDWLDSF